MQPRILALALCIASEGVALADDNPKCDAEAGLRVREVTAMVSPDSGTDEKCYRAGSTAAVDADIDHIIVVDVTKPPNGMQGRKYHATITGPLKGTPPSTLEVVDLDETAPQRTQLLLDPQARGLSAGDKLAIEAAITDLAGNADPSRPLKTTLYVRFKHYGLTHHEADALLFVRSAQSSRWDARPGATAMFGYDFRKDSFGSHTWNFFSPRGGVHVALLDYSGSQKVEFGVGPTVSVLQGGITAGVGWNLSTNFTQKRYFFLGISFVNIANIIKGKLGDNAKK